MKVDVPKQSAEVKRFGPFYLIDNEMVSGVMVMLPWPLRDVQIQIFKARVNDL